MATCAWRSCKEWDDVFELLYSSDVSNKENGLSRVAGWRARGSVPALMEVTVDLVSCIVQEQERNRRLDQFSDHVLQLMYATALTRFVNGVYDVHFVTSSAPEKDIKTVLGHFGVPPYIVALRHECAHKTLPSLESLKVAADFGLQWLLHNYWEPQSLLNQQVEKTRMLGESVQFSVSGRVTNTQSEVESRKRKKLYRTKAVISRCSKMELSEHLLRGDILNPDYKISLSEETSLLPRLVIDGNSWSHWISAIRRVAEERDGVETLVLCSLITAIHHPHCCMERKHFLAGCIRLLLVESSREPCLPMKYVNWMELYSTVLEKPGLYSEALLKIVLPHVKPHLPTSADLVMDHLTSLMTKSENLSLNAYRRNPTTLPSIITVVSLPQLMMNFMLNHFNLLSFQTR